MAELKKCDIPKLSDKEFYNRLDDIRTIFNYLPDELKDTIREKKKTEDNKMFNEKISRLEMQIEAQKNGVYLTDEELKLPLNELEFIIQNRKSWNRLTNPNSMY